MKHGLVQRHGWGCSTTFADGTEAKATFPTAPGIEREDYCAISHRTGYEYDLHRYCFEHDVAHMVIEEWLHDRPSRVLWGCAHGQPLSGNEAAYEELAAQALQRFVRAAERPLIGGVDWNGARQLMLAALGRITYAVDEEAMTCAPAVPAPAEQRPA